MNYSQALITGKGITLTEALSTGGKVTVLGLAIVFAVLVVLMLILMLFKVIFYKDPQKQKNKAQSEESKLQSVEPQINEEELIAVLTAAVAASLNTSTYNLNIKSYRRIEDKKPAWNKAGLRETINNRF